MRILTCLFLAILISGCQKSPHFVHLPAIISDGMVLQQNTEVSLWGKSSPNAMIEIRSSWGNRLSVKANTDGKWIGKLKTPTAGGPFEVTFQTSDTNIVVKNVLVGEVWMCSGQSNMEMPMCGWPPDTISNWASEIAAANYPEMRLFTIQHNATPAPVEDCEAEWLECTPKNVNNFSSTAYFFGRKLNQELKVPVGLIHSSWGGTPAESWISKEYLSNFPKYQAIVNAYDSILVEFDILMKWMDRLPVIAMPADTQGFESVQLNDMEYASFDCNDSDWPVMELPSLWEAKGLTDYDGIVWFRKEFDLPAGMSGKDMVLHLGAIDDMDATYVNGIKVGSILEDGHYKQSRDYTIPAKILKNGKNVIAVQVIDTRGGGGIYEKTEMTIGIKGSAKFQVQLNGDWKYRPVAEILKGKIYVYGKDSNSFDSRPKLTGRISAYSPVTLFNGMINPVVPYTIKGAIWYQGEANVGKGYEYRTLFPTLIKCWRNTWDIGDFPFYFVQIAPYNYNEQEPGPSSEVREAQLMTLNVPNTGMVVTTDIGNPENIHPANKQDVGKRLAIWALAKTYGQDSLIYSGPIYDSITIESNKAIIHFKYAESGLVAKEGPLTWFEIAGIDKKYYPATAAIQGQTVVVTSCKVKEPVAVRFGWNQIAQPNLFNGAGLPASPFRTDNWKRESEE